MRPSASAINPAVLSFLTIVGIIFLVVCTNIWIVFPALWIDFVYHLDKNKRIVLEHVSTHFCIKDKLSVKLLLEA